VLFDVLPDDLVTPAVRARYRTVLDVSKAAELPNGLSRFKAPVTVRVSASRPKEGKELTLHFVNYNRVEPKEKRSAGGGIKDEKPIAVDEVSVDFVVPKGMKVTRVVVTTPESADAVEVKHTIRDGRIQFVVPRFLVYAIARLQ
jgi:hypothetical protein